MALLYKNNNTWYLSNTYNGIGKTRSLKTKSYKIGKTIKPHAESTLLAEINGFVTKYKNLSFDLLCKRFLVRNHDWSINIYKLIKHIFSSHLVGKSLPSNPTSKTIHIRHINQFWKCSIKNNRFQKTKLLSGNIKSESRNRVLRGTKLKTLLS